MTSIHSFYDGSIVQFLFLKFVRIIYCPINRTALHLTIKMSLLYLHKLRNEYKVQSSHTDCHTAFENQQHLK